LEAHQGTTDELDMKMNLIVITLLLILIAFPVHH